MNDPDQPVNGPDQTVTWLASMGDEMPERFPAFADSVNVDDGPSSDPATGLVSLAFIGAALRRGTKIWLTLAVIGFLVGCGLYLAFPTPHKATASVLLVDDPNQDPNIEVQTDIALAESAPVAAGVVHQLGLRQTPSSFLGTYSVTLVTDQVLLITASGSSSDQAMQRASAVASQFLKFRAQYAQTLLQQTQAQLNLQNSQAQQRVDSINSQIKQLQSQSSGSDQQARLNRLRAQQDAAVNALQQVQQYVANTLASAQTVTQKMVRGSEVLNSATPAKRSVVKNGLLYAGGGLAAGLALGMVIVIVGAVTSDRLRRRDDIAYAFGAPVRLSVGPLRESRWVPDLRGRSAVRHRDMDRVVEHLRNAIPGSSRGPAGLAVVAVDDAQTAAKAVVALAVSSARQRRRVVLADLSAGTHAARLLGADSPGIGMVSPDGVRIVVFVPTADDVAPVGPLRSRTSPDGYAQADDSLAAACADADLVLSLVTLDPAFGGGHLATWATDVVALVTAGRSTSVRVHAVGEMVQLAGVRLGSVVVIDADKSDESLGATSAAYQTAPL